MNNTAKTVTFVVVIVVLATIVILGYSLYKNQNNAAKAPYSTTNIAPKPTEQPVVSGEKISESNSNKAIDSELNATSLEDASMDFKDLEQQVSSL